MTWPRCHTPQQAWAIWARTRLLAHLREHRLGSSLIAAMSAFSPSMLPRWQISFPATLRTEGGEDKCVTWPSITHRRIWGVCSRCGGILKAQELRHLHDRLRNGFDALRLQVVVRETVSRNSLVKLSGFRKVIAPAITLPPSLNSCAHLSSRKCAFPAMQAPMMMADAILSRLPERSIDSTGLMPFSSSMGRGWPSTLWQHGDV